MTTNRIFSKAAIVIRARNFVQSTAALIQRVTANQKATVKRMKVAGNTILAIKSSILLARFTPSPWPDCKTADIKISQDIY